MREIRFRAWDVIDKMWYKGISEYLWDSEVFEFNEKNLIFCQFTGLHDKNSKEIYEGDIISVEWCDALYQVNFGEYTLIGECCQGDYCEGEIDHGISVGYYITPKGTLNRNNTYPLKSTEVYAVIGNIYENPELIK